MSSTFDNVWDQCSELARQENILASFSVAVDAAGLAGEERAAQLLYLTLTSRLLNKPVSAVLKGSSSSGKSYTLDNVAKFFPPDAYFSMSSMSPRALVYLEEPLAHRYLIVCESAGVQNRDLDYLVRSLLSEGRLSYMTTVRTHTGIETITVDRPGPTGFITTTTGQLHPENETRMLSIPVDDSLAQTRRVLLKQAQHGQAAPDRSAWYALQAWIALGEPIVAVPYAVALATAIADADPPLRIRRDFVALLSLIEAHTLIHRASRQRGDDGRIVATMQDYTAVRGLVADLIGARPAAPMDPTVRETVDAVHRIAEETGQRVTVDALAERLGIDKSNASRRVKRAVEARQLENRSRPGQAGDLVATSTSADQIGILPTSEELTERLRGCAGCATAEASSAPESSPMPLTAANHVNPSSPTPGGPL